MAQFTDASVCIFAMNETHSLSRCVEIILDTNEPCDLSEILIITGKQASEECIDTVNSLMRETGAVPIRTLRQTRNGLGGACLDAVDAARGSHLMTVAGDLECDPYKVHELIELAKQNPDSEIKASRAAGNSSWKGYGALRQAGNALFQRFVTHLYRCDVTDITFAFQISPIERLRSFNWLDNGTSWPLEVTLHAVKAGMTVIEIPMEWHARSENEKRIRLLRDAGRLISYTAAALKLK